MNGLSFLLLVVFLQSHYAFKLYSIQRHFQSSLLAKKSLESRTKEGETLQLATTLEDEVQTWRLSNIQVPLDEDPGKGNLY
jgi:hypothetical protein